MTTTGRNFLFTGDSFGSGGTGGTGSGGIGGTGSGGIGGTGSGGPGGTGSGGPGGTGSGGTGGTGTGDIGGTGSGGTGGTGSGGIGGGGTGGTRRTNGANYQMSGLRRGFAGKIDESKSMWLGFWQDVRIFRVSPTLEYDGGGRS